MLFDVSPSELILILIVALVVFGPRRLPELAKRLASVVRDIQATATELRHGLEKEVKDVTRPVDDLTRPIRDLARPIPDPHLPEGDKAADKDEPSSADDE